MNHEIITLIDGHFRKQTHHQTYDYVLQVTYLMGTIITKLQEHNDNKDNMINGKQWSTVKGKIVFTKAQGRRVALSTLSTWGRHTPSLPPFFCAF